jgi:hypothetical protein
MNQKELKYEIEKLHIDAASLWQQMHRIIDAGKCTVINDEVTFCKERFFAIYNNIFCHQADLKDLLEKLKDVPTGPHTGENIIDFTEQAPKHRGKKPQKERKKPL